MNDFMIVSRPWQPQDLLDDLQLLIDEEPDNYLNFRRTTMCTARDYLKEHFAEPSWISVEDRLPEPLVDVLAWDSNWREAFTAYMTRHNEWVGVVASHKVTHWMPLPEPPEVEV